MISPQLYWIMTGDDFTLDINNPQAPKILCVGNNPDRQNIYGAALGLYNSRIVKLINKKGMLKSSVLIDELPTIYFKGLGQPDCHRTKQQSGGMLGLSGLFPVEAGLWKQGGCRGDEHGWEHFFGTGGRRDCKDALGEVWEGASETAKHEHHP